MYENDLNDFQSDLDSIVAGDEQRAQRKSVRKPSIDPQKVQSILDRMRGATSGQESSGNSRIVNKDSGATGEFQVMPDNVPRWTRKYYNRQLSVDEFRNNPEAQLAVFNGEMGSYVRKALARSRGDEDKAIRMASAAWYGGERAMHRFDDPTPQYYKGDKSKKYPSFREYTTSVLSRAKGINAKQAGFSDFLSGLDKIIPANTPQDELQNFQSGLDNAAKLPSLEDFTAGLDTIVSMPQPAPTEPQKFLQSPQIEPTEKIESLPLVENTKDTNFIEGGRTALNQQKQIRQSAQTKKPIKHGENISVRILDDETAPDEISQPSQTAPPMTAAEKLLSRGASPLVDLRDVVSDLPKMREEALTRALVQSGISPADAREEVRYQTEKHGSPLDTSDDELKKLLEIEGDKGKGFLRVNLSPEMFRRIGERRAAYNRIDREEAARDRIRQQILAETTAQNDRDDSVMNARGEVVTADTDLTPAQLEEEVNRRLEAERREANGSFSNAERLRDEARQMDSIEYGVNVVNAGVQGIADGFAAIPDAVGLAQSAFERGVLGRDTEARNTLAGQTSQAMKDSFAKSFKVHSGLKDDALVQISRTFGQVVPPLILGGIGNAARLGTRGVRVLSGAFEGGQIASEAYRTAIKKGATENQALVTAFIAAPIGAAVGGLSEKVLFKQLAGLQQLDDLTRGQFTTTFLQTLQETAARRGKEAIKGGATELFEETVQNTTSKLAAAGVYENEPLTTEKVGRILGESIKESLPAFVVGGGMSTAAGLAAPNVVSETTQEISEPISAIQPEAAKSPDEPVLSEAKPETLVYKSDGGIEFHRAENEDGTITETVLQNGQKIGGRTFQKESGQVETKSAEIILHDTTENGAVKPYAADAAPATETSLQSDLDEKQGTSETVSEEKPKHEFSSTQVNLPKAESDKVLAIGKNLIKDEDLAEDGRETSPHITVKFGLHTENAADVLPILKDVAPFEVTLGKTSVFPAKEGSDHDVVKIDVESPELHRINKLIAENTETTDTHPEYKPHATLAYVKKGKGAKYAGNSELEGTKLKFDKIVFSDKNRQTIEIPLTGKTSTKIESTQKIASKQKTEIPPLKPGAKFQTNPESPVYEVVSVSRYDNNLVKFKNIESGETFERRLKPSNVSRYTATEQSTETTQSKSDVKVTASPEIVRQNGKIAVIQNGKTVREFADTTKGAEKADRLLKQLKVEFDSQHKNPDPVLASRLPNTFRENYGKAIDDYFDGTLPHGKVPVLSSRTPEILQNLGFGDRAVVITQDVLDKATKGKHKDKGLTREIFKSIPALLNKPIFVIENDDPRAPAGSLLIVTRRQNESNQFISVALHPDRIIDRVIVNKVASVHPRDLKYAVRNWKRNNSFRYVNKKMSREIATSYGDEFASLVQSVLDSSPSLLTEKDLVKKSGENTQKRSTVSNPVDYSVLSANELVPIAAEKPVAIKDGALALTAPQMEIVNRVLEKIELEYGNLKQGVSNILALDGAFIPRIKTLDVLNELQFLAEQEKYAKYRQFFTDFANRVSEAANTTGTTVLYNIEAKSKTVLYHEKQHQASHIGAEGTLIKNRVDTKAGQQRPEFSIIRKNLTEKFGYEDDAPLLIEEAMAFIVQGANEEIGLTKEQADAFAEWWYTSYSEQGHDLDHQLFYEAALATREVLNDVRQKRDEQRRTAEKSESARPSESRSTDGRTRSLQARELAGIPRPAKGKVQGTETRPSGKSTERSRISESAENPLFAISRQDAGFRAILAEAESDPEKRNLLQKALSPLWSGNRQSSAAEIIVNFRRAGLLTGVRTHLKNVVSNTAFQASDEISRPIQVLADLTASAFTGRRTVQGLSPNAILKSLKSVAITDDVMKAAKKQGGLATAWQIIKHGDTKENLEKQQLEEMRSGSPLLDAYVNGVFRSLQAEDAIFKAYAFRRSLEESAAVIARNERAKDKSVDKKKRAAELLQKPNDQMIADAAVFADYATFQNDNRISDITKKIKEVHPGIKTVTEILVPFDRTPTNVILRTLEFSPIGYFFAGKSVIDYRRGTNGKFKSAKEKAAQRNTVFDRKLQRRREREDFRIETEIKANENFLTQPDLPDTTREKIEQDIAMLQREREKVQNLRSVNELHVKERREAVEQMLQDLFNRDQQRAFARTFGRASIGSAGLVLGVVLASKGLLSGIWDYDEDDKQESNEARRRRKAGIENGSLLVPNVGRFVILDSPLGKTLALGATIYEQSMMPRKKGETAAGRAVSVTGDVAESTIFDQPLLKATQDYLTPKNFKKDPGGKVGGLAGSFVPTIVADAGEVLDEKPRKATGFSNSVLRRIPVAREQADESKSGVSPKERGGFWRRLWRSVDPFNTRSPIPSKSNKNKKTR